MDIQSKNSIDIAINQFETVNLYIKPNDCIIVITEASYKTIFTNEQYYNGYPLAIEMDNKELSIAIMPKQLIYSTKPN